MVDTVVTPVQIIQTPDVLGGKARIEGRRISVAHVAGHVVHHGWSLEQMKEAFNLRPAEIHAALAYYFDHQEEIDRLLEAEEAAWENVPEFEEVFTLLDEFMTTADAASQLGISERRVLVLIDEGRLPARKLGNQWIIHPDDLERDDIRNRKPGRPPKSNK